jgi:hypothetical protein
LRLKSISKSDGDLIKKLLLAIFPCLAAAILVLAFHRTEHSREKDPGGEYTAIWTYRTYHLINVFAVGRGSLSDYPCRVRIENSRGESMGEIPVPTISLSGVEWSSRGAEVRGVGEWDFSMGSCYYWSEDQMTQIYVRRNGHPVR